MILIHIPEGETLIVRTRNLLVKIQDDVSNLNALPDKLHIEVQEPPYDESGEGDIVMADDFIYSVHNK